MFPWVLIPVTVLAMSGFILARSHLAWRIVIASVLFGLSGGLIFAFCFLWWGIGGFAFRTTATLWAIGLNVVNLGVGIIVIRRLRGPELSPLQPDVAPPDEPRLG